MPAPLKITLTQEEDETLKELFQARCVPKSTSERARMLRLNAQGWKVPEIAKIVECHVQ